MNSETNILPPLPIQSQDFEEIRRNNGLYIDKSEYAYKLLNTPFLKNCFIGRPRRFGKSLFLSMLEAYAQGKKNLFKGLKAEKLETEWKQYEVLKFDFSAGVNAKSFSGKISYYLSYYEKIYLGETKEGLEFCERFMNLIDAASKGEYEKVVILIDEYDAPLTSYLYTNGDKEKEEEREKIMEIYRGLFPVVKEKSHLIKLFFLTGIMKFMGLHIFSTLNNVKILTSDKKYGSLFGFTHEELRGSLMPYIEELAKNEKKTPEQVIDELINMYDSYCFCRDLSQRVFNPYSLINCFSDKEIKSYWSVSGRTKLVFDMIKTQNYDVPDFNNVWIDAPSVEESDSAPDNMIQTLFQSGYLTIDFYDKEWDRYKLRVPNREVRQSLVTTIIPLLVKDKTESDVRMQTEAIRINLSRGNVKDAMEQMKALVASTPYSNEKTGFVVEDRFQTIVSLAFFFCGYKTRREVTVSGGDIDIVAENDTNVFVIETKMSSKGGVKKAMAQIKNRGYAEAYCADTRNIYTIAMCFDKKKRILKEYEILKVK